MHSLNLRLRIFLFFCLLALGGVALIAAGLVVGLRQLGDPTGVSAFVSAGLVSGLGLVGLVSAVWLMFDENVAKPIDALAAGLRLRAHNRQGRSPGTETARYLGDFAPAVAALDNRLAESDTATEKAVAAATAQLERQREQLLRILSDIPVAVIVARRDHQIVLYDGQAADLMERECPARLMGSVFDYLEEAAIVQALGALGQGDRKRLEIAVQGRSGALYKGHIRSFGDDTGYTLMLEPLGPEAARPLVYDFDLLDRAPAPDLADRALRDLSFVVFDSETTGLDPQGDAVVQIAAVRVVNGRRVPGEVLDLLVDPGRPIPPASSRVHGITDAMVAGAPGFDVACRRMHQFATGAVIVAHNAPFDMAFLRRESARAEYRFDNPILDTVHLSAAVFGGAADHTLDGLCERLDVRIPPEQRHTALGDARATAEALVALIPVLEARGLGTLAEVRAETLRHQRILTVQA